MEIVGVVILLALILGALFLWRQSQSKGRFGIGELTGTHCPRCGTQLPMIRKPSSSEEALWGGWTCPSCGCKVDRYGRERTAD